MNNVCYRSNATGKIMPKVFLRHILRRYEVHVKTSGVFDNVITGMRPFITYRKASEFARLCVNAFGCDVSLCKKM